ncbi:MAG: NUDIX domain-containing protein [Bacteroidota bacterium]
MNNKFRDDIIDALSIDCLIFGFNGDLKVLLVQHGEGISKGKWAIPGGWIKYNESLDDAAYRILQATTGVRDIFLEQLKTFGDIDRFPDKRVLTVAYFSLVKPENYEISPGFTASDARWFNLRKTPELIYDHHEILQFGLDHLKHQVRHFPIGFNLLPEKFTLHQLQQLYEAILEVKLDKPNFRRKFLKMGLLIDCEEKQQDVAHRAASLYRFDEQVYTELKDKGFNFEF